MTRICKDPEHRRQINLMNILDKSRVSRRGQKPQTDVATFRLNWPRGQYRENMADGRPLNLIMCTDSSTRF